MNDPHVDMLHYSIRHSEGVDYTAASPQEGRHTSFTVRIESGQATVSMVDHCATAEDARVIVEPFLRAWELSSALSDWSGFEFVFQRADIIDRSPSPRSLDAQAGFHAVGGLRTSEKVQKATYPTPPVGLATDAYVEMMFDRYRNYRKGLTTLSDAANFCLTAVEHAGLTALASGKARDRAAKHFYIERMVLNKVGELCSTKGGAEARKAIGVKHEFSNAERTWLQEAMKKLIHRAAEVANDSSIKYPKLTMAHLPPLPLGARAICCQHVLAAPQARVGISPIRRMERRRL